MESILNEARQVIHTYLVPLSARIAAALALWLVGSTLIRLAIAASGRVMRVRAVDPTLIRYAESFMRISLRILLGVAALGVLGVATTSFAALLAAAGVALGMAWSGLLANFAAGVFLVLQRPFRVGDLVTAGGVTGTVREIGLFACVLDSTDNHRVQIGNNRLFAENIINHTANPTRRGETRIPLMHGLELDAVLPQLLDCATRSEFVLIDPPTEIAVLEFTADGPVVSLKYHVRPLDLVHAQGDVNRRVALWMQQHDWPLAGRGRGNGGGQRCLPKSGEAAEAPAGPQPATATLRASPGVRADRETD